MGLHITTDEKGIMIFRDDKRSYPSYYYSVSRKNDKGEYDSCYKTVKFKKDVSVENKTIISIKNAFESFDINKDDPKKKYPYLMITDFEVMKAPEPEITIPDTDEDAVPFD